MSSRPARDRPWDSGFRWMKTCWRVALCHRKKGLPSWARRSRKSTDLAATSSSKVFMRSMVSGPSSVAGPPAVQETMPRGLNFVWNSGIGGAIRVLQVLVGVQVVEVAPELVEAVPAGQVLVQVAQVVLAELGRGVALGLEDLGERDVLGLEPGRGARGADRRQPGAHRQLAGDEGRAPRGAARLGVEGAEPQPFAADAVDVGCRHAHDCRCRRTRRSSSRCRRP